MLIAEMDYITAWSSIVGNTVFEPGKDGSHYKGSGSGSGDKEEKKTGDEKQNKQESDKSKSWVLGVLADSLMRVV